MRSSRSTSVAGPSAASASAPAPPPLIKIALLGDANVGKTSLMVRYVENEYDETQLPTQGVNFMERTVRLQQHEVTFSIWDIGGGKDNESMLPLVCNDAAALLFMFDLARLETLDSIREWHKKARGLNVEINNGRAAMLGIFGFMAASKVDGSVPALSFIKPYAGDYMQPFEGNFDLFA